VRPRVCDDRPVALYRFGDKGESVRDIRDRLSALDFDCGGDPPAEFGEGTRRAVTEFQESRNLAADGMVGRETWRTLVDAGFRMGDRLLYYRLPMLHGDDVASLQHDLDALGFEVAGVDGIFGPGTLRAVLDFQQNRRMAEDGIVGRKIVEELSLMVRATRKLGRDIVREREWMRMRAGGLAGQRVLIDPFCRDPLEAATTWEAATAAIDAVKSHGGHPLLSRSADTQPPERMRAARANELAVDLVLGFSLPRTDVAGVYYFASAISHSEAGAALAGYVAERIGLEALGRTMPILMETRAPAILVTVPSPDAGTGLAAVAALHRWLRETAEQADQEPESSR